MFTKIQDIQEYINVSDLLDIEYLKPYEESAIDRVQSFIPASVMNDLPEGDIKENIRKSVANYMIAYAIPFIKIHWSNTGANQYNDEKQDKASWWDVRDYGLSAVKMADMAMSKAINLLLDSGMSDELTLFDQDFTLKVLFANPEDFNQINGSWDVFRSLQPLIQEVFDFSINNRLGNCNLEVILQDEKASRLLKSVITDFVVIEVIDSDVLTFSKNGIVAQWEELPWQKSKLFDESYLLKIKDLKEKKANQKFKSLLDYMRFRPSDFPCLEENTGDVNLTVITKKSGLYLL